MRGRRSQFCLGFLAAIALTAAAAPAHADMLNESAGTLVLDNFIVAQPGRNPVNFNNPPWLTATFKGTVGSNTFTLELQTSDWGSAYSSNYVVIWNFMSTIPVSDITLPSGFVKNPNNDTAGVMTFGLSNAMLYENADVTYTFTLTGGATYNPADFDVLSPGGTPDGMAYPTVKAYSLAIIGPNDQYYVADVAPEPSRPVGLLGIAGLGAIGLCLSGAKRLRPAVG